jgi:2-polyprenyl-3-methyl-5-hydroxy-6-metoxy-1,4-benzoquinol methylase
MHNDKIESVASLFDSKADSWSQKYGSKLQNRHAVYNEALRRYYRPAARLLDAGCGSGALTCLALDIGYEVTAVDVSEKMISACRTATAERSPGPTILNGDITVLSSQFALFDCIVCSSVFEYIPNPSRYLSMMSSLLVRKGYLFISIPNVLSIERVIEAVARPFACMSTPIGLPSRLDAYRKYLVLSKNRLSLSAFESLSSGNALSVVERTWFGNHGGLLKKNDFVKTMLFYVLQKN